MKTRMLPVVVGAMLVTGCGITLPTGPLIDVPPLGTLVRQDALFDAAGDAALQPDLISGEMQVYSSGVLLFVGRFAAGTFSTPNTVVNIYIDLDGNTATGFNDAAAGEPTAVSGWEYRIQISKFPGSTAVQRAKSPTTFEHVGPGGNVSYSSAKDTINVSESAQLLEIDDKNHPAATVRVVALHRTQIQPITVSDYMPDLGAVISRVR